MRIRLATDADAPALALLRRLWTEEGQAGPPTPAENADYETAFAEWWAAERDHRLFWLAEDPGTGEPLGFINLLVFTRMPRPGRTTTGWGYIGNAFVRADRRGAGVGTLLMDAVVRYADDRGLVRLVLSPTERAVSFYRRAGFGPADMLMSRLPE
ncbi:GNAT family N-acetyltransferase [Actinokineospora enzanensis]|uniref:GNAT family N-acetyltransferase n=1 Tax=Actinokineospora enzanensis TaxID=155975 RepID=UPI00036C60EC|nr:GNAT family N-acetyltransferase [Actinokineospora enzanensis]